MFNPLHNALIIQGSSRTLSHWRCINYFKPLLDAYFDPYKLKYPFWMGLQLLIRSSFFGLSAFGTTIGLFSGVVLVAITHCIHGILHPFKSRFKNIQESLVLPIFWLYMQQHYVLISATFISCLLSEFLSLLHCCTLFCVIV